MVAKKYLVVVLFFLGALRIWAQQGTTPSDNIGLSAQLYPAGFIPTGNFEHFLSEKESLVFRLGFNFTDRQDFSDVNETEEGDGFGGSIGYRKHFRLHKGRIIAGLNVDIWSLNIDWTDLGQNDEPISGETYILVFQPWLEGGYFLPIKNTGSQLGLTLGFGREVNVITSGDEVAQGFIGSVTLQYLFGI